MVCFVNRLILLNCNSKSWSATEINIYLKWEAEYKAHFEVNQKFASISTQIKEKSPEASKTSW